MAGGRDMLAFCLSIEKSRQEGSCKEERRGPATYSDLQGILLGPSSGLSILAALQKIVSQVITIGKSHAPISVVRIG